MQSQPCIWYCACEEESLSPPWWLWQGSTTRRRWFAASKCMSLNLWYLSIFFVEHQFSSSCLCGNMSYLGISTCFSNSQVTNALPAWSRRNSITQEESMVQVQQPALAWICTFTSLEIEQIVSHQSLHSYGAVKFRDHMPAVENFLKKSSCFKSVRRFLVTNYFFHCRCYARLHPRAVNCRKKKCGHSNQVCQAVSSVLLVRTVSCVCGIVRVGMD
jgi:hypothetical protein